VRRGGGESCGGACGRARLGPGGPSCRFRRRGQTPPSTGGLVVESCGNSGREGGVSPQACVRASARGKAGFGDRSLWECLNERAKMGAGEIRAGTARSRGPAARFARGSEGAGQPPALAAQARCFARGSEGVAARAAATGSEKAPAQAQGESRFWASCGGGVRRGGGEGCGGAGGRARLGPGGPSCRFRRRGQTPPSTGGLVVESCSDSGRDGGVSPRTCAQAGGESGV